jgi:hypothetical protein
MMMETGEMMPTEEAMMEVDDMVMLAPATFEGEDPACTDLRTEVETYLYTTLSAGKIMMESSGG